MKSGQLRWAVVFSAAALIGVGLASQALTSPAAHHDAEPILEFTAKKLNVEGLPVRREVEDIHRVVTMTRTPALAAMLPLDRVMNKSLGAKGHDVAPSILRACSAAQNARRTGAELLDEVSLTEMESRFAGRQLESDVPWRANDRVAEQFRFLAGAPRFVGKFYHLKLIYELGADTNDEYAYDQGYAVMIMPIFKIASADEQEYLSDVLALREPAASTPAFFDKWVGRADLHSIKVGCTGKREPANDWVWFQLGLGVVDGRLDVRLLAQTVPSLNAGAEPIKVSTVSYATSDDARVDDKVETVQRSVSGALTCSQCHRRVYRSHTLHEERGADQSRDLDKLGIMTFFVHIGANHRNPGMGPTKSRYQNSQEEYHLQVLNQLAETRLGRKTDQVARGY